MEVKNVEPTKVFYHSEVTTLDGIHDVANREIDKMYEEVEQIGLKEVAPLQFMYLGFKPETSFTLEIALVVEEEKPYNGQYKIKDLDGFKCVSTIHNGSINQIGETYEKFMLELMKNGKKMTDQIREVYHKYIGLDSPENITEIQIGVN